MGTSKDQVRVWLATVVAPLLAGLAVEAEYIRKGNWSFRAHLKDFHFLMETDRMVAKVFTANLLQFWRKNIDAKQAADNHDRNIEALRQCCVETCDALLGTPEFEQRAILGNQAHRDDYAEFVINGIRALPEEYGAIASFWNTHADTFLELRKDRALAPAFLNIESVGKTVGDDVMLLFGKLRELQERLADEYELPPVDPSAANL